MRKQGSKLPFHTFAASGSTEIPPALEEFRSLVGRVTLQWSTLQEALAELFAEVVSPQNHSIGLAIWNVLQSDRNQRDQLRAAVSEAFEESSTAAAEIAWVLDRINECATDRNRITHSPFTLRWNDGDPYVVTSTVTRNRRANQLAGRDLITEAAACHERLVKLSVYAVRLREALETDTPAAAWPPRPAI